MSYHNKQDPLSLILMRDIINHPSEFIPNVSLEVRWTDILGTLFHVDKKSGQNCLIIVHTNGLIIYDRNNNTNGLIIDYCTYKSKY